MNRRLDCVQISYDSSLGISDDLINFWNESIKNKNKKDCIQIWYGCYLGISDDLFNFWDESIINKMAAAAI